MSSPNGRRALDNLAANDRITAAMVEYEFFSRWAAAAAVGAKEAADISQFVPPEALLGQFNRQAYAFLAERLARGEPTNDMVTDRALSHIARETGGEGTWRSGLLLLEPADEPEHLRDYARQLLVHYRARTQYELLEGAAMLTQAAAEKGESVKRIADELTDRLMHLHSRTSENAGPQTQGEIVKHLLARVDSEAPAGIEWPWPLMQETLGVITPGAVVGITAYSGQGKTLFASNLVREFLRREIPCIIFPTEMQLQFLERVVAGLARVPKEFAEEGDWRKATKAQMRRYRLAMQDMEGLPWDIVQEADITIPEAIARARILRRKYRGRHVIFIFDHMHRAEYGPGVRADDQNGAASGTKQIKNFVQSDREGGMSAILLYQPRKPEDEEKVFAPVLGATGVRGHGGSFNELDVHMSCFRRIVETTNNAFTPWGTPLAVYEHEHSRMPKRGAYRAPGSKIDDEHVYVTADKHRIRGSIMETMMLNIHGPSGFIHQEDWLAGVDTNNED